ncbi:hypothetical protein CRYUN_Cryun11dG0046200 [Craigia yunnanensis]
MEEHKQAETVNGCSILLEPSDDDPFFDKKKAVLSHVWQKLLNERELGVEEIVRIKSSLDPDSPSATLNQMLQIAKIIHLDELYFGQVDGVGFYSPKNEMEALNVILSLIKTSFSSQVHMQTHALQDLQNAIVNRIHEHGAKDKVENKIDINYNCDKEECLLQWAENNGVKTRANIAYVEGAGRGAIAMEDLEVGDIAMEIPAFIIISEDLVHNSDKHLNLKEEVFRLSFGVEATMALDGTLLFEEIMQAKEVIHYQAVQYAAYIYT